MYTEERPRRGGLLKEFILKLILIIIFVLLLIWLVPWPNMDALNPLKDQIFNANLQTMKEAGISYFTTERLPENVGDKTTITLQKMLDMKLVIPFTDKNGNTCDVKKSYVSLEKQETEYLMKVNLKCGDEERYILVHLGCYSYCTSDICEAKPNNTEKPSTTPKTYKCKIVDGKYWGKDSKVVSKEQYEKECTKPTESPKTYKCKIVDGKYWGKNYTIVSKEQYEKECTKPTVTPTPTPPTTTYTCKYVDGKYWGKNATVVSKEQYEKECTTPTYTCQIINGQYWGKAGVVVTQQQYEDECLEKEWEYSKTITNTISHAAVYSEWSKWTTYTLKKGEEIPKSTRFMEVVDLGEKRVAIGTQAAIYENIYEEHYEMLKAGSVSYKLCTGYNYVADASTVYRVLTDWVATDEYKAGYRESIPYDTLDTRWVLQSVDFDVCKETCTSHPYAIYRKYTRRIEKTTEYTNITAHCANWEEKTIDIYVSTPVGKYYTVLKQAAQTIYGNIHQYKTRTRTLISEAYTETQTKLLIEWSYYNDLNLINNGYKMTGNSRPKTN